MRIKKGFVYKRIDIGPEQADSSHNHCRKFANPSPFDEWNYGTTPYTFNCFAFICGAKAPGVSHLEPGSYRVTVPRPGFTGGYVLNAPTLGFLRQALIADKFIPLPNIIQNRVTIPHGYILIAAFVSSHPKLQGYHFYRFLEPAGTWFHKPGWVFPVTHLDASHAPIKDIQKANCKPFDVFAGYYLIPDSGIKLDIRIEPIDPSKMSAWKRNSQIPAQRELRHMLRQMVL